VAFIAAQTGYGEKPEVKEEYPKYVPPAAPYYHGGYPYGGYNYGAGYPYGGYPYYNYPGFPYNYGGFPYYYHGFPYSGGFPYVHPAPAPAYQHLAYAGKFEGTCSGVLDGLYYVDDRSFAFCANGVKTIQSCAEGSGNPSYGDFEKGVYKNIADFCSVNLVAKNQF